MANLARGYWVTLGRIELVQPLVPKPCAVGQHRCSPWRNTTKRTGREYPEDEIDGTDDIRSVDRAFRRR